MTDFLERAIHEAERYGSDPWIFIRELLQNARDAGAREVTIVTNELDGQTRLWFRDNGEGMGFEHAQRFLFRLYASSKEGQDGQAGRFGVGFWSLLRFKPRRIHIRSWPRSGEAPWEVVLEGGLAQAIKRTPPASSEPGTEIILERDAVPGDPVSPHLFDAAWRNARFLEVRGKRGTPLRIHVDGREVNAPFSLPAPSAAFGSGGQRGVVALGKQPGVELFSRGLRVRSAAALRDLLPMPDADKAGKRKAAPPVAGLAPQALLESDKLELLLSRSDTRDDAGLRRLVALAEYELSRLVARQLELARPRSAREVATGWLGDNPVATMAGALLTLALLAIGFNTYVRPRLEPARAPVGRTVPAYRELANYEGPRTNALAAGARPIALRYAPADAVLFLGAVRVNDLDAEGRPVLAVTANAPPYASGRCVADCVEVGVAVMDGPGVLRLPLPPGHRVDVESVTLDGQPVEVFASSSDEPFLKLSGPTRARLRYRTGIGPTLLMAPSQGRPLPEPIQQLKQALLKLPRGERVEAALAWVARTVVYTTEPGKAAHPAVAGEGFLARTLRAGAGDCDVQNGVLTLVLQEVGIPARMTLGFVGRNGGVAPWLHAWVEYGDEHGVLQVADASARAPVAEPASEPEEEPVATAPPARPAKAPAAEKPTRLYPVGEAPPAAPSGAPAATPPQAVAEASPAPAPALPELLADTDVPLLPRFLRALLLTASCLLVVSSLLSLLFRKLLEPVRLRLDPERDASDLLRGLLTHPESFPHVPELMHRPLLARAGGGAVSLRKAWKAARVGRLYSSTQAGSKLARQAARGGAVVLDPGQREAMTVAQLLSAVELDNWDQLLALSHSSPLLDAVNAHLRSCRQRWSVCAVRGISSSHRLLLALPRPGPSRLVLNAAEPWLVEAELRMATEPARALFDAVDRISALLKLEDDGRARLLAPVAQVALQEEARR